MPRTLDFRNKLEALINEYNMESGSSTPDFILANYLMACLEAYDHAVQCRDAWFGRIERAGRPLGAPMPPSPPGAFVVVNEDPSHYADCRPPNVAQAYYEPLDVPPDSLKTVQEPRCDQKAPPGAS